MTIKTNADEKVILRISANLDLEGTHIVDDIPEVQAGYDLYFDGKEFTQRENPNYAKAIERTTLQQELDGIRQWLADNDWKVNKVVIGEWSNTDERWQAYLTERTVKRARQDEIIAEMGGI